jgi:DNA-directed RNA polymerase subunit H (RpoH/RPB5)
MAVLVGAGMYAAAPKLSSVLFVGQGSGVAASDHSALLEAFAEMNPVDAHVHLYKDDPAFSALLERLKLRILDICLIDDRDPYFKAIEPQRGDVQRAVHSTSGRAVLCTTFSPYDFEQIPGIVGSARKPQN